MLIREYRESDLAALRAIHAAQGFDYALPDLRNPLFLTKLVLVADGTPEPPRPDSTAASPPSVGAQHAAPQTSPAPQSGTGTTLGLAVSSANQTTENRAGKCDSQNAAAASPPILGAALLRLTAEAYLLLDPRAGTPRQRWQWLLALHEVARRDAWQRGLEDVHAWLPPQIAHKFGKRITQLGWIRDDAWTPYCKRL